MSRLQNNPYIMAVLVVLLALLASFGVRALQSGKPARPSERAKFDTGEKPSTISVMRYRAHTIEPERPHLPRRAVPA